MVYLPPPSTTTSGFTEVPWLWSGMNGVTLMAALSRPAPEPSLRAIDQLLTPFAGGAGVLSRGLTVKPSLAFPRPAAEGSPRLSVAQRRRPAVPAPVAPAAPPPAAASAA